LVFGLLVGLFLGLFVGGFLGLVSGLQALLQHYTLRFWLSRTNSLPFHIVPFLEDACACQGRWNPEPIWN